MSLVTIASQDIADWHGSETPAYARLIANQEFVTSENVIVAPGNGFYQQFTCSVVSNKIRIASAQAYSTTDSDTPWSTYTLAVYSAKGSLLTTIAGNLRIPNAPSSTTWTALIEYSQARVQPYRFAFYDTNQINVLLNNYALLSDVYTQTQVNALLAVYYTQAQVNSLLANYYTQSQINTVLADYYTAAQTDALFALKLDASKLLTAQLTSNAAYANNNTLADTNLSVPVAAGGHYEVNAVLHVTSGSTGGFKCKFDGTSTDANFIAQYLAIVASTGANITGGLGVSRITPLNVTGQTIYTITINGSIEISTAGTFLIQAAQSVSDATTTTLFRGSTLRLHKTN
jgi:hypothetical protein